MSMSKEMRHASGMRHSFAVHESEGYIDIGLIIDPRQTGPAYALFNAGKYPCQARIYSAKPYVSQSLAFRDVLG